MEDRSSVQVRTHFLTLREAAAHLNVTERFMRRMVSERKVRFYKIGKLLRFDVVDLEALAKEHTVGVDDGLADRVWLSSRGLS